MTFERRSSRSQAKDSQAPSFVSTVHTVCPSILSANRSRALVTTFCRYLLSSSGREWSDNPTGYLMAFPSMIRLAPTFKAKLGMAVIRTEGRPNLSISLANVAPQRVPVPQVEVTITAMMF